MDTIYFRGPLAQVSRARSVVKGILLSPADHIWGSSQNNGEEIKIPSGPRVSFMVLILMDSRISRLSCVYSSFCFRLEVRRV